MADPGEQILNAMSGAIHDAAQDESDDYRGMARAALTTLYANLRAMGWRVVPIEATHDMVGVSQVTEPGFPPPVSDRVVRVLWSEMVAAAPPPPGLTSPAPSARTP